MLGPARYLADFARFLTTKSAQEQADAQALGELEQRPLDLPRGLELESPRRDPERQRRLRGGGAATAEKE